MTIHVEDCGHGPILYCLHGIGGTAASFASLAARWQSRFRVLAWDAPGYGASANPPEGFSMADYGRVAAEALGQVGADRAVVMGHSFGAVCALAMAQSHPEMVAGLILVDATLGDRTQPAAVKDAHLRARIDAVTTLSIEEMARRRTPEVLSEFASPAVHDETRRVMSQVRRRGYIAAAQAIHDADALPAARSWKGPTLLVWGERDTVTPLAYAERLRAAMPQAELAVLPRASHMVYLEQEALFDDTVARFAERVHAGR